MIIINAWLAKHHLMLAFWFCDEIGSTHSVSKPATGFMHRVSTREWSLRNQIKQIEKKKKNNSNSGGGGGSSVTEVLAPTTIKLSMRSIWMLIALCNCLRQRNTRECGKMHGTNKTKICTILHYDKQKPGKLVIILACLHKQYMSNTWIERNYQHQTLANIVA